MNTKFLIDSALRLSPAKQFTLIDELIHRLNRPDPSIDRLWVKEAKLRLAEHRAGRIRGIPASDVVGDF